MSTTTSVHWLERINAKSICLAAVLGFGIAPVVEIVFNITNRRRNNEKKKTDFQKTFIFNAIESIVVGARAWGMVLLLVVAIDIFQLQNQLPFEAEIDTIVAAQIGTVVWFCATICAIKKAIFKKMIGRENLGRVALYDKLIDFIVLVGGMANVLNLLSIEVGMGLQSIFAASGFSALAFSLASKGFIEQIISGFFVHAWDAIEEGEAVKLGDGTEGVVQRIGLTETTIVGYDNIAVRIPNSQLTMQRVSNISRLTMSQIKQFFRIKYSDIDKIPNLLMDIQSEISAACPKVIVDGSKPFQAMIMSYETDHIQAFVNCHFPFRPFIAEYAENRQNVLFAIATAMKKNNMEFAIPSIQYHSKQTN